jgi:hypothetical protein
MMTGPKHQAPARGRYALLVIFAALVGIAAVLLHRAYEMWAPTHGRAIAGTWTETREEHWYKPAPGSATSPQLAAARYATRSP